MYPEKCFGFSLDLVHEFTEIVPIDFGPFVVNYQGLFANVKIVFFINQLQPKTKAPVWKLERILMKL